MSGSDRELPRASFVEGARFTLQVMLPNVLQGLFRRRRRAVAAATRLDVDGQAIDAIRALREAHGPGPLWVRAGREQLLLVTATEDVRRVLECSPEPFASDPDAKRRGMAHFQPDALTISRGRLWENRRRFAEAVLDTGRPLHRRAPRFREVVAEEAEALLAEARARRGRIEWDAFGECVRRIARRVVLGDAARDDGELSDLLATLMDEANNLPSGRSESYVPFLARVVRYVNAAQEGSLVALFAEAPADDETKPPGQAIHWLFALGDTLAVNVFRALALTLAHPDERAAVEAELIAAGDALATADGIAALERLRACLFESMRLYPTTPILSRETVEETEWDGSTVPPGTQVLISNTFNHRDPERHESADLFRPAQWIQGDAAEDWSFNHFSHGPQGCPGAELATFVGVALMADLIGGAGLRLAAPRLDSGRPLPHMLDFFSIRLSLDRRA